MCTRREFLKQSTIISMMPTIPLFLNSACTAQSPNKNRILVVVQLSGGNDGLNTVVPFRDNRYQAYRKELRLPENTLIKLDDSLAFHPAMRGMAEQFQNGRLAIVEGVGYPKPNRSHDVSMAVWHTARMDQESHRDFGWLGRGLDRGSNRSQVPAAITTMPNETPLALRGRKCQISNIDSLDDFRIAKPAKPINTNPSASVPKSSSSLSQFMQQTELEAQILVEQIRTLSGPGNRERNESLSRLGSSVSKQLSVIAELIQLGFGATVFYAAQSGYDTHSIQLNTHGELLNTLSTGLNAFLKDLEASGHADRVLVLCFSEFGRQVVENASFGTDHGTAGPVFLVGQGVRGGIYGKTPDLSVLEDNAPHFTVDFRDVYAGVLKNWLQIDPAQVLDGHATALEVIAT